jgi:hypothetical protein
MRCGQVVEHATLLVRLGRRYGDADDAVGTLKGIDEIVFAEIGREAAFELRAVHHRAAFQDIGQAQRLERIEIEPARLQHRVEFFVAAHGDGAGDDAAGRRAGQHPRQQLLFMQRLDHAEMEHAQGAAA